MASKIVLQGKYIRVYYKKKYWSIAGLDFSEDWKIKDGFKLVGNTEAVSRRDKKELEDANLLIANTLHKYDRIITDSLFKDLNPIAEINRILHTKQDEKVKENENHLNVIFETYINNKIKRFVGIKRDSTIARWKAEKSSLQEYILNSKCKNEVSDFDLDWVLAYCRYMSEPQTRDYSNLINTKRNYSYSYQKTFALRNSTMRIRISEIIQSIKEYSKSHPELIIDFQTIYDFLKQDLIVPRDDPRTIVTLSENQIKDYKDFEHTEAFAKLRKGKRNGYYMYLFGLQTGMRYSDISKLNDRYVKGNIITMEATKTNSRFSVQMNKDALRIYEKFDRDFVDKFPCGNDINEILRSIVELIPSFHELKADYRYVFKKDNYEMIPLCEMLTFHSSRKTFLTYLIKSNPNVTLPFIMGTMGWKDVSMITTYLDTFRKKGEGEELVLGFV